MHNNKSTCIHTKIVTMHVHNSELTPLNPYFKS